MNELSNTVANGFIHSYRNLTEKVHALSETLSEEQFWTKPYPYGNSFGHLILHIIGNFNYYIGTEIAGTGYVREREREFTEQAPPSKEEVLRQLDEALELVIATIKEQTAEDWSSRYEAEGALDFVNNRFSIVLRCATHFHHHIGQMIYLEKEFSK
jgi:uncharacterized damage-inducible protein DinB